MSLFRFVTGKPNETPKESQQENREVPKIPKEIAGCSGKKCKSCKSCKALDKVTHKKKSQMECEICGSTENIYGTPDGNTFCDVHYQEWLEQQDKKEAIEAGEDEDV